MHYYQQYLLQAEVRSVFYRPVNAAKPAQNELQQEVSRSIHACFPQTPHFSTSTLSVENVSSKQSGAGFSQMGFLGRTSGKF